MRSLLLILATVVGVVLLAVAYISLQAPTPKIATSVLIPSTLPAPRPVRSSTNSTTDEAMPVVQGGEDVWVTVPDDSGGIKWQFRAARHDPRPDNSVDVVQPQARFYFKNGQVVTLDGARGRAIIPSATARNTDFRSAVMSPPSRGELYDVTISLYDAAYLETPMMVSEMNNVSFDNDTFRIATESYTQADGTVVPADQVPVKVRGRSTDFDGRGLTIQWNDRDRRLEMMEIAHGESLTIKTLGTASSTTKPAAPVLEAPPRQPVAEARGRAPVRPDRARGAAQEIAKPAPRPVNQPAYRATFSGGVKVTQVDQTIATAETMMVDFKMDEEETPVTPAPPVAPRRGARRGPVPVSQPVVVPPPPATQRHNSPVRGLFAKSPTSQPGEPYVIRWPGKLVVLPINDEKSLLQPGQQIVQMTSGDAPVVLRHLGNEIQCASFLFNDADGSLVVRSSEKFPKISMKDEQGKALYTPSLVYSGTTGKCLLEGQSRAEFPLQDDKNQIAGLMKTEWSKLCELTMAGQSTDRMTIQQAVISGDVKVEHPQLTMQSSTLRTEFAPVTDPTQKQSVQPKSMIAEGEVKCDIVQADKKVQHITSDRLELTTRTGPDGKITPDKVIADGKVHAFDDAQQEDLRAGQLEVTLAPTTQPGDAARIQHLLARDDVRFASKTASGSANRLEVETSSIDKDQVTLMLIGTDPPARITSGDSNLFGQFITIRQNAVKNQQSIHVTGAGSMNGSQKQAASEKPMPFEVSWSKVLDFDSSTNVGKADGDVTVTTVTSDGAKNTMFGQRLSMELADDPNAATSQKSDSALSSTMGKKSLRSMLLDGDCEVKSILADADGNLQRRIHLFGPKVQIENVEGQNWQVIVPSAGRMLVDDHKPTTRPSGTAPTASLGDLSGATAFQWEKQLTYDQSKNTAEMLGDVRILHPAVDATSQMFQIEAQRVAAEFETNTTKTPSTQPADEQKLKLKRLSADEKVWFKANNIEFAAHQMSFDPVAQTIDARGAPGIPVQIFGANSAANGSWQEATWNTQTQKIILREGQTLIPR